MSTANRFRAAASGADDGRSRMAILAGLMALVFAGLGLRAGELALDGVSAGAARTAAAAPAEASVRADILDRRGRVLATTLTAHSLWADPRAVWDAEATARALADALPTLDVADTAQKLAGEGRFVWLARGLSPRERQAVFDLGLPGLAFREEPRRVYPNGAIAAHVLGWTDTDGRGLAGAERAFEAELTGPGARPLALSIDLGAQFVVEDALAAGIVETRAAAGAAVVIDVETGEIIALASAPTFDPNAAGAADPEARRNRALASVYELGSVFKVVTYAMAVDALDLSPDTLLPTSIRTAGGRTVADTHARGTSAPAIQAFVRSSNAGAAALALDAGSAHHADYFTRFGLLERAPVEYAESARPIAPEDYGDGARVNLAFGYGAAVSPTAFVSAFAAIVNGGLYVRPTLRPADPRGAPVERVLDPETSAAMRLFLRAAVTEGTGQRADAPGLRVGGKTGTALKAIPGGYDQDRVVASFVAAFPIEAPRYGLLVVLDEPQGDPDAPGGAAVNAGYTAAPVAGEIIAGLASALGIPRETSPTPSLVGYAPPRARDETPPEGAFAG